MLGDIVYEALREAILSGHLEEGQRLNEREFSRELGVSVTPVKRALHRLAYEGLVKVLPRSGTYVAETIRTPLQEMCQIRAALEGVASRLAAQKATGDDISALERQLRIMQHLTEEAYDADRLYAANTRFHELIYKSARNPYVVHLLTVLRAFTTGVRRRALADIAEARRGLQDHQAICEAIASKNPDMTEARMRAHILRTLEYLVHPANAEDGSPTRIPGSGNSKELRTP